VGCNSGFGQWFFLEWDCLPVRSWQGPVGFPHTKCACHQIGGRRWYSWFCPVGNCSLCSWRSREFAGYDCWGRVVDNGHCSRYSVQATFNLRCGLCWVLYGACWRVWCRRQYPHKGVLQCTVLGMVVVAADCWPSIGESAGKGLGSQDSQVVVRIGC